MDYSLEQSVGFMLGLTHRKTSALLAAQFKPYDITTEQFSVLFNVVRKEGVNQKEMAGFVFKDQPTTARIIDLLEKKAGSSAARATRTVEPICCILPKMAKH